MCRKVGAATRGLGGNGLGFKLVLLIALIHLGLTTSAAGFEAFSCITHNDADDCAIGTAQLSATLVESGGDALLTITMAGSDVGVVEQLFIESSLVSGIGFQGSIASGTVAFGSGQAGGNLPGGKTVSFSAAFNIAANNPAPRNGIGRHPQDDVSPQAGEFLLSLAGGSFNDLLLDLRIGVHVTGYTSGGSESFVVVTTVPEPGTAALFSLGLLALSLRRFRSPPAR
jgi:hypothetical protein